MEIIETNWRGINEVEEREFEDGIRQYRIVVENEDLFPEHIDKLEKILEEIEKDGGAVNFQKRPFSLTEVATKAELSDDAPAGLVDIERKLAEMWNDIRKNKNHNKE